MLNALHAAWYISTAATDSPPMHLAFSNRYCGASVQQYGALSSYPTLAQMDAQA